MDLSKHCHALDFTSLREVPNRSQSIFNLHASAYMYMLSLRLAASQRTIGLSNTINFFQNSNLFKLAKSVIGKHLQ